MPRALQSAPTPLPQPNPAQPLEIVTYQRVAVVERMLPARYYRARRLTEEEVVFDDAKKVDAAPLAPAEGGVHRRLVSAADSTETCYAGGWMVGQWKWLGETIG